MLFKDNEKLLKDCFVVLSQIQYTNYCEVEIPVRHGKRVAGISGLNRSLNHGISRQFHSANEVNIMLPGNGEQRNQTTFTCIVQQIVYSENVLPNNRSPPRQMCHNSGLSKLK
jgi:hypothetical protein